MPTGTGPLRSCGRCGAAYRTDFQRCPADGTELFASSTDPLVGTVIGEHYAIEALIGEGAMGRVYRAHHVLLTNKRFAVKVLLGDLAVRSAMRMRFAREADAASRLEHPSIVAVSDFGRSTTGLLYIVMELVDGETLRRLIARGPMSPARVERLARQVIQGLSHAHERGVVHRDLKPDNILVTPGLTGELARIGDFGLALTREDDERLTQSGIVCTPAYAAPEQLLGGAIDHRADLYALGVTLYEMLSGGVMPFPDDPGRKILDDAPSAALVSPHAPATLVRLIGRLLERDPAKRPASALDVLAQLDAGALEPTAPIEIVSEQGPRRRRLSTGGLAAKLGEQQMPAERPRLGRAVLLAGVAGISGALAFAAVTRTHAIAAPGAASLDPVLREESSPGLRVHAAAAELAPPPVTAAALVINAAPRRAAPMSSSPIARPPQMPEAPASPIVLATAPVQVAPLSAPPPDAVPAPHATAPLVVRAAARRIPPAPHAVELVALDVEGSLSRAVVERALARVRPELHACIAPSYVVSARFTIDDSRRATDLHVAGPRCVTDALAHVRTEVAPDIGDATVSVRFR